MLSAVTLLLCVFVILLFRILWLTKRPENFPPGPKPLPIIGNFYQLPKGHIYTFFKEWGKVYGSIIGLMAPPAQPIVFIDGVDNVLAALRKEEFQSRPVSYVVKARTFGKNLGIFFSIGEQWASSRKFVVKQMRAYGKAEKEEVIAEEITQLMEKIRDAECTEGKGMFSVSAVNVIWSIMANRRLDLNDKKACQFLNNITIMFRQGSPSGGGDLVNFVPIFRFFSKKYKLAQKIIGEVQNFIKETIEDHREVLDPENPLDLIDHYLVEMENNRSSANSLFTEEDLISIGVDLFSAGAESTSNSIDFILLYMILYPEVQRKMQDEIDRVLSRSRKPRLEDRSELNYTMAVITEVERLNSIAPTNVPHYCTKNTTFEGHFIPKDTFILMNLRSLGYDNQYWQNPEEFYPERFLDVNGKFSRPSHLALFGIGARMCVGEVFARNIIFLFTTTFFEKFSVSLPPGEPKPSTEPLSGFTTAPQPFNISIKSRY